MSEACVSSQSSSLILELLICMYLNAHCHQITVPHGNNCHCLVLTPASLLSLYESPAIGLMPWRECTREQPRALSQLPPNLTSQPQSHYNLSALPVWSRQAFYFLVLSCPLMHSTRPVAVSCGASLAQFLLLLFSLPPRGFDAPFGIVGIKNMQL